MPFRCSVPKCKGNYDDGPKVSAFAFPKDPELKKKWVQAIKREGFVPTNSSRVCELHFEEHQIKRTMESFDERSGKHLSAPLKLARIVKGAIPTKLPGCPQYLSSSSCSYRESPDSKKVKKESDHLQKAIAESFISSETYTSARAFDNLDEAYTKIQQNCNFSDWIVSKENGFIVFIYMEYIPNPVVKGLIYICQNLNLTLEYMGKNISSFKNTNNINRKFPFPVNNLNQLEEILLDVKKFFSQNYEEHDLENSCILITNVLEHITAKLPDKKNQIEFLQEQINLLKITKKGALRYSWKTTLFCSLLFSISPHCYKFLRGSNTLTLPCTSTIKQVCSQFKTDPGKEQLDSNFLRYVRSKFKHLGEQDKLVTLMVDEIHIKPFFDYKGGNVVGAAYNTTESATSAHVFMINSLRSPYKEVVYILPVKTLKANSLHYFIKKVIIGLEEIGFQVFVVVSDNNAINRKAMSFFSDPPEIRVEYPHPTNPTRPLFFVIDSVHILKNLRNNWINQPTQCMKFPDFIDSDSQSSSKLACFQTLKDMHNKECGQLLKYGYTLTLKALYPTSIERQNVKLALQVLNKNIVVALRELGPKINLSNYDTTADYIEILCRWWDIVNVKNPFKGQRLRNKFAEPVTKKSQHIYDFLKNFLQWLKKWQPGTGGGGLTKETHFAITHTTTAFMKITQYFLFNDQESNNMSYLLLGQIQTDKLEERFGKYRYHAGCQYHVSIRQVFESESKLRIQSVIPLMLKSQKFGEIVVTKESLMDFLEDDNLETPEISPELKLGLEITEDDMLKISDKIWPSIVYISGYAAFSVSRHIKCQYCKIYLIENETENSVQFNLITANDRGGLCYPNQDVVTCTAYTYLVLEGLLKNEDCFLRNTCQRNILKSMSIEILDGLDIELFLGHSCTEHSYHFLVNAVIKTISNILLKNYVKNQNDILNPKTMPEIKRTKPKKN